MGVHDRLDHCSLAEYVNLRTVRAKSGMPKEVLAFTFCYFLLFMLQRYHARLRSSIINVETIHVKNQVHGALSKSHTSNFFERYN